MSVNKILEKLDGGEMMVVVVGESSSVRWLAYQNLSTRFDLSQLSHFSHDFEKEKKLHVQFKVNAFVDV